MTDNKENAEMKVEKPTQEEAKKALSHADREHAEKAESILVDLITDFLREKRGLDEKEHEGLRIEYEMRWHNKVRMLNKIRKSITFDRNVFTERIRLIEAHLKNP